MSTIRLQSSDGKVFKTKTEIAKTSGTIRNLLEDCQIEDGFDAVIPLKNVSADILQKVLEYAEHHKDDDVSPDDEDDKCRRTDNISQWDADFLKVDQEILFQLVLAANFLDLKGLLNVVCKTLANMLKNKTADEIRKTFDLVNDFTAEEEDQIRKENEWCGEY
ncbi:S-phase kinase-associated protein 1-like [Bradysia coprophila]|uniref:S-phase kinase-associated protein 1-like n=1 Tax=Bradysia coprophila TaxID=38358 RepID=UPI00187D7299|nr:S-phase kinase-associated protein 1-like [Bradysia coprophila]